MPNRHEFRVDATSGEDLAVKQHDAPAEETSSPRGVAHLVVTSDLESFGAFYASVCELLSYAGQFPVRLIRAIADEPDRFFRLTIHHHEEIAAGTYRATLAVEPTDLFRELQRALRANEVDKDLFVRVVHCQLRSDDGMGSRLAATERFPAHDTTEEASHA